MGGLTRSTTERRAWVQLGIQSTGTTRVVHQGHECGCVTEHQGRRAEARWTPPRCASPLAARQRRPQAAWKRQGRRPWPRGGRRCDPAGEPWKCSQSLRAQAAAEASGQAAPDHKPQRALRLRESRKSHPRPPRSHFLSESQGRRRALPRSVTPGCEGQDEEKKMCEWEGLLQGTLF